MHTPVLTTEVMEMLDPVSDGRYVDATLGGGGHTRELLKRLDEGGVVIAMDRDEEALKRARRQIEDRRVIFQQGRFSEMAEKVRSLGYRDVEGVIMDLGISMIQIKDEERGFSLYSRAPLDMRMDRSLPLTAGDIVNTWSEREIERILREYGEERKAARIARAIVTERRKARIETCLQLSSLLERVCRRRGRIHPATRTFQALRIAVNNELEELSAGLRNATGILKIGGRLCVISYHSLEDRIVKRYFIEAEKQGRLRRLNKKPVVPGREELRRNPSSRSAKLRGAEKV